MVDEVYLGQLKSEKEGIDPAYRIAIKLLNNEIERVEKHGRYTEIHHPKKLKLSEKIRIPINQFPKHNFVGKLLGPGGTTLKGLQAECGTKMSILGKGSMKDKSKEEELRKEGDPKNEHLNDDLHVAVEVLSTPADCHARMSHALAELEKYLVPENEFGEVIQQQQMAEMGYHANGEPQHAPTPSQGYAPRGRPMMGSRGHHAPGAPSSRGRAPMAPSPRGRGASSVRGAPLGVRGRGAPRARGAPSRGAMPIGGGMGRASRAAAPPPSSRSYAPPPSSHSHAPIYAEEEAYPAYEEPAYDSYSAETYDTPSYGGTGSDSQSYDYGHGYSARDHYDDGYAAETSTYGGSNGYKSAYKTSVSSRPSSRGSSRAHPYASSGRGARY